MASVSNINDENRPARSEILLILNSSSSYVDGQNEGRASNLFFTDEKFFIVNPALNSLNTRQHLQHDY
uniref:Uncharacterized protein n=1 Tax=Heterorhabditis bacteriophora TaxID=37862 RepID=A0A1I7XBP9_HETBA